MKNLIGLTLAATVLTCSSLVAMEKENTETKRSTALVKSEEKVFLDQYLDTVSEIVHMMCMDNPRELDRFAESEVDANNFLKRLTAAIAQKKPVPQEKMTPAFKKDLISGISTLLAKTYIEFRKKQ